MRLAINLTLIALLTALFACGSLPKMPELNPKKMAWDKTVKPQVVSKCNSIGIKAEEETDKINDGVYLYVLGDDSEGGLAKVKEGLSAGGDDATKKFKTQLAGLKTVVSAVPGAGDASAKLDELAAALEAPKK